MIGQGVANPSYAQRPAFFAGILGMLSALAGTLLVMGFIGTRDDIAQRLQEDLQASLAQVLPAEIYDNTPSLDYLDVPAEGAADGDDDSAKKVRLYRASRADTPVAMAFEVVGNGYAGPIRVLMGVRSDGELLGVRVLAHTETPGLGDKIEVAKDNWIRSFDGLSLDKLPLERWKVKKDGGVFDQFSGATITPRAVVGAVARGLVQQRGFQPLVAAAPQQSRVTAQAKEAP